MSEMSKTPAKAILEAVEGRPGVYTYVETELRVSRLAILGGIALADVAQAGLRAIAFLEARIETLEGMVAYLEGSIPDDPRAEANLIDARRIRQERDDAVLAHHLALARIEALEEERDGLHAAMTVFEATWDTGGYMEPDEMWEKCWPAVDKFVPAEHQSLVWAVEQQGQERAALAAEGSSASGRYRVTRLTAEQMDTDVVVVPGETEDRAENDDPALAAKGKPTDE